MYRSYQTVVCCLALAFAAPLAAIAADSPREKTAAASEPAKKAVSEQKVEQQKQDQTAEKRRQITAEAMAAVSETRNALKALDENKKDEALAALERATGKLDLILARDPNLALAPTNVTAETINIIADEDRVKAIRKEAQKLLDEGRVQPARHLLEALASETDINVSNIPLATYPDAIKKAAKLIDDGKQDEAKNALQTALNTLVITQTVIPLPVFEATEFLRDAEALAEKKSRSNEENKHLGDLLKDAQKRLEFAEVLGYGTRQNFKDLYAQLDQIKGKTSDGKSGTGLFAAIKSSISDLIRLGQPPKDQPASGIGSASGTGTNTTHVNTTAK